MAKSKKVVKKIPNKPMFKVPSGYAIVSSAGYASAHDFEKVPTLEGTITQIRPVTLNAGKKNEKETRVATVEKENGDTVAVWESAALAGLFEACYVGEGKKRKFQAQEVFIHFDGTKDVGQPQPMKLFTCGIKN